MQKVERHNKFLPINYRCTTWKWEQWLATITFIAMFFICHGNRYWDIQSRQMPFIFGSIIGTGAIIVAQLYVYGGGVTNSKKDVIVPLVVTFITMLVDLLIFFVVIKMKGVIFWGCFFKKYACLFVQLLMVGFVYLRIEHQKIPVEVYERIINS